MKKLLILFLIAGCTAANPSHMYRITKAEQKGDKSLVWIKGFRGKYLLTPPPGKDSLVKGDSISIFHLKPSR